MDPIPFIGQVLTICLLIVLAPPLTRRLLRFHQTPARAWYQFGSADFWVSLPLLLVVVILVLVVLESINY
ncbi:MAG: hypothetical protein A3A44_03485 [Candidatus Sungbacteria bacterium RIFCSPLOWO2_01_FULL_60_25]|uniref:Uncharacterized protein n=1 Tax=Candidatus Sungbacteria bacterium RIFCSPLOWO2_01_FULL_60_25 TaxID=1802281 RepID=A0A1G2LEV0_9BACT|nr:MAG: hypothetical protein A3A44_03485 [Candidatus Sungbacteria bacterium RIFCSPLOWO2_01_FULL_60_25]